MPNAIVKGDLLPVLEGHLQNSDTTPVDLTGATVSIRFSKPGGSVVTASAAIINAVGGIVQYAWQSGDTNTAGNLLVVFIVTRSGLPQTYPTAAPITVQVIASV